MTDGNTDAINKHLDEREDYDALQEVTTELERAEARIEELEAESKTLRSMVADVIHDTGDDPEIMVASRAEWAARAFTAEAKLAKAREEGFWVGRSCGGSKKEIDDALSELKGQDDG